MENLSTKIINKLAAANIAVEALFNMTVEDIANVKGIGPKFLEEIQQWIQNNKPTVEPVIVNKDKYDIEAIRTAILNNKNCEEAINKKGNDEVKYVTSLFLNKGVDYSYISKILEKLYLDNDQIGIAIGKLSMRIGFPCPKSFSNFSFERMKSILSSLILHGLVDTKQIISETKTEKEADKITGKVQWHTRTFLTMGTKPEENMLHGLHSEPGVVLQKTVKTKIGGKNTKLSASQKGFLAQVSSMELRLVKTPRDEMRNYLESTKWYKAFDEGKVQGDKPTLRIKNNSRVEKLLDIIEEAQSKKVCYLSAWFDYRNRMYYDFNLDGINPHGKTFETSQWELAYPIMIEDDAAEHYFYSAVCIVDGRTSHQSAKLKFLANKDHYLNALKTPNDDIGESFYNKRLAEAIEHYYAKVPSRFLLSEDATNGGMQNGGVGFKCESMMKSSNVGGVDKQLDSHETLQITLGLETRQDAKDIHQPLLHGSTLATIAKLMKVSKDEAREMMIKAYGHEVLNIQEIANWGTQAVDNNNTVLTWKSIDGFICQSVAYVKSVPLTIFAPSAVNKCGYSTTVIHRDMPVFLKHDGKSVYGATIKKDKDGKVVLNKNGKPELDKSNGGEVKLRGLYANITHSIDGFILRNVIRFLIRHGASGLFKHDNFLTHGNHMGIVRTAFQGGLLRSYDYSPYEMALQDIVESHRGETKPEAPTLIIGNAARELIEKSEYFLSA